MPLETHDLALALRDLGAPLTLALPGFGLTLARVARGDRFEHHAKVATTVLVLEGTGSVAVDDWKATLAGGLVVGVPAQSHLVIAADAGVAMSVLLTAALPDPSAAAD